MGVLLVLVSALIGYELLRCACLFNRDALCAVTDLRLAQGFAIVYVVWAILANLRVVTSDTGAGLILASYGVHCRLFADVIEYGMPQIVWFEEPWGATFSEFSSAPSSLSTLTSWLMHGGLAAYVLGLAMLVLGCWADIRARLRARRNC